MTPATEEALSQIPRKTDTSGRGHEHEWWHQGDQMAKWVCFGVGMLEYEKPQPVLGLQNISGTFGETNQAKELPPVARPLD